MTRIAAVPLVILLVSGGVSAAAARPAEDVTVFVEVEGTPGIGSSARGCALSSALAARHLRCRLSRSRCSTSGATWE